VFYNKRKVDLLYSTVINQILMMIIVTAFIFFSHKLAFPRSVIIISTIISTILLGISRIINHNLYIELNGREKVMVVGTEKSCKRAVRNFEGARSEAYKITKAVYNNFYKNTKNNLKDVDVVYLTKNIPEEEKKKIYSLLTKKEKQIFLSNRKSTRLNSSHVSISYAVFCLKKKKKIIIDY